MIKKYSRSIAIAILIGMILTACGKDKETNNYYTTSSTPAVMEEMTTTVDPDAPRVDIGDITIQAGDNIDYLSNITPIENIEIEKCMIAVDSSAVNRYKPGAYPVFYSVDYMGKMISKQITLTVLEGNGEEIVTTAQAETQNTEEETGTEETVTVNPEETQTTEETDLLPEQILENPPIKLSTGKEVFVKCTSTRYIVETYTEDTYFEENGYSFIKSELKVMFNTGEIEVIETVKNRVQPNSVPS